MSGKQESISNMMDRQATIFRSSMIKEILVFGQGGRNETAVGEGETNLCCVEQRTAPPRPVSLTQNLSDV